MRRTICAGLVLALVSAGCASEEARTAGAGDQAFETMGLREFRDCEQCPLMVELPPGRFVMGSPDSEEEAAGNGKRPEHTILAEKPQVEVEIEYPLAVGKFEVTFAEWDHCVDQGGCSYRPDDMGWGRGDRPVINLSRPDVQQYLDWLSRHTGQEYRLPSEAEWEYAARGGTSTARHWGDVLGTGNAVCDGCGSQWDKRSTAPVGSFAPNRFGLHDMLGNAREWIADCWHPTHEGHPGTGAARIESSPSWKDGVCERPANRGASWGSFGWAIRAAGRNSWRPGPWSDRESNYGFRVVRTVSVPDETRAAVAGGSSTDGGVPRSALLHGHA
jgi:formylglycine-generating enzyme required for sulfatase activity